MEPVIVPRSEHTISRKLIDPDAVKVLYRLHRAGYQAYLVGGGVRDLLVGRSPKDFDISTDAHPHQVKRLFRNCRLIGRRFRLAHVHFGEKIVEVSTFRRRSDPLDGEEAEDLLIRSDNTFGNAEEDALRRDFTINGLFYDIGSFSLIDYVGGLADLKTHLIRTIGDPDIRFREDPVRMIRAVKFAARLGFRIEPETFEAILRHREELSKSAQPRLLEEVYRLLGGGAAEASFRLLHETGLLDVLMPAVAQHLHDESSRGVESTTSPFWGWLASLDRMKEEGRARSNAILLAVLLGPVAFPEPVIEEQDEASEGPHFGYETEDHLRTILGTLGVPRRETERIFQVYRAQRRMVGGRGRRFSPRAFVLKNYFQEAWQFFRVMAAMTGQFADAVQKWDELAETTPGAASGSEGPRRRRRRRRRGRGGREGFDAPLESGEGRNGYEGPLEGDEVSETRFEAGPAPARHDDDEDSQIRFLGWSDQPEILKPRSTPAAPPVNPYTRGARTGEQRVGWRGARRDDGRRQPNRGGTAPPLDRGQRDTRTSGGASGAPRRGRRGRRRPRRSE